MTAYYTVPELILYVGRVADLASAISFGLSHNPATPPQARQIAEALGSTAEALYGLTKGLKNGSAGDLDIAIATSIAEIVGGVAGSFAGSGLAINGAIPLAAAAALLGAPLSPLAAGILVMGLASAGAYFGSKFPSFLGNLLGKGLSMLRDPLILDLDGDGIEVSALDGSAVYFDYDSDGVAERTGWVSPDDGMLAYDATFVDALLRRPTGRRIAMHGGNGIVDGIARMRVGIRSVDKTALFGSPSQDGFEVLETLDSNQDGVTARCDPPSIHAAQRRAQQIDAADPAFAALTRTNVTFRTDWTVLVDRAANEDVKLSGEFSQALSCRPIERFRLLHGAAA